MNYYTVTLVLQGPDAGWHWHVFDGDMHGVARSERLAHKAARDYLDSRPSTLPPLPTQPVRHTPWPVIHERLSDYYDDTDDDHEPVKLFDDKGPY